MVAPKGAKSAASIQAGIGIGGAYGDAAPKRSNHKACAGMIKSVAASHGTRKMFRNGMVERAARMSAAAAMESIGMDRDMAGPGKFLSSIGLGS